MTYQPDVILIGDGPSSIKSVSANGLEWTIDGGADGVDDLAPGKVMFAASEAVGRVVDVEPAGDDVTVTLAPVELTDVVRDGTIHLDQPLDLDSATFQEIPDPVGAVSIPSTSGGAALPAAFVAPPIRLVALTDAPEGLPPPVGGSQLKRSIAGWDVTAYKSSTMLGLKAERGLAKGTGLKATIDMHLTVDDLHVESNTPVEDGTVGLTKFLVHGITGFAIDLAAGVAEGAGDNEKVKIEVPIEIKQPVIVGGFPGMLKETFKFLVETAFSAKNATLQASGAWSLDGPLGFDGAAVSVPSATRQKSLLNSLSGISIGVNGIVAAMEFRFGLEIGLPIAGAGPFAGVVVSTGLTNGSAGGLVRCRGVTLLGSVKGGVSISLSSHVQKALEKLLHVTVPGEKELLKKDIINKSEVIPRVPLCGA